MIRQADTLRRSIVIVISYVSNANCCVVLQTVDVVSLQIDAFFRRLSIQVK